MKNEKYIPNQDDLNWVKNITNLVKDGGIWGCWWGAYILDQKNQKLVLNNLVSDDPNVGEMLHRTEQTFEAIGWTVDHSKANGG